MPDETQLPLGRNPDAPSDTASTAADAPPADDSSPMDADPSLHESGSEETTAITMVVTDATETETETPSADAARTAAEEAASVAEEAASTADASATTSAAEPAPETPPAEIPAMVIYPPVDAPAPPADVPAAPAAAAPPVPPAGTVTTTTTVSTTSTTPRRPVRPRIFKQDMTAPPLNGLDWSAQAADESLELVRLHLTADAREAIEWYSESKKSKRSCAMGIRVTAVLTTALAAVVPLVAQMAQGNTSDYEPLRDLSLVIQEPALVAVLLAVAGAAMALDKFFGFSTGWVRFIKAGQQLRDSMEDFELEWETQRSARGGMEPTPQEVASALDLARAFSGKINGIVQEETNTWIQEFQTSMQAVQDAVGSARTTAQQRADAAAAADAARSTAGALAVVNLTVTNGADCAPDGWTVTVDDEQPRRAAGNQVAVPGVRPGARTFKVSGVAGGKPVQASFALQVAPGSITQATTTLA